MRKRSTSIFDLVGKGGFAAGNGVPQPKRGTKDGLASLEEQPKKANPFELKEDIVLQEYLAHAAGLPKSAVLRFCRSKRLEDFIEDRVVKWGSIVIGQDGADGWLTCGDAFLPMKLEETVVLEPRKFSTVVVPKPKPWVKRKPVTPEPAPGAGVGELEDPTKKDTEKEKDGFNSEKTRPSIGPLEIKRSLNTMSAASSEAEAEAKFDPPVMIEKMPVESRLPVLEPSHWLAPGGVRAPHRSPLRNVPDDLQEAAMRGDVALVRQLVEVGVSVNAPIRALQDEEFLTLLHVLSCRPAIPNGTRILFELLRSKANPNTRSSLGSTPLIFACQHKHVAAVEVLLEFGAEASPVDDHSRTAVRCALIPDADVPNSEELAVELCDLLGASGADLDAGGLVAPIVEAVMQHNGPAVKALIRLGATPDGLIEAVFNAPVAMIQDLIEAETNPFVRDSSGKTVMEIALSRGEEAVTTMLRNYIGDLERGNHPHLITRTFAGTQELMQDQSLRQTKQYEPKDGQSRKDGQRKSLADRIIEQHMAALRGSRPMTRKEKFWASLHKGCKHLCKTYTFQIVMLVVLAMALFLPDFWIILNIESAAPLDVMLIIIFIAFMAEFVLQVIGLQRHYVFKFVFWMDIIGWWSVPLDHSLVTNSIVGAFQGKVDGPTLARVTKLVKLGARAGRMSRLVKILRFLPGMGNKDSHVGTAAVMSKIINMRISIQVASIIIVMVIVLPLIDLSRYPQVDNSMLAWARLVDQAAKFHTDDVGSMISNMQEFYDNMRYCPYKVTIVFANGTSATVDLKDPPVRSADSLIVVAPGSTSTLTFDFRGPNLMEALLSILLMFTIVAMIFAAAVLVSHGVTSIVLRPMEKMLSVVKDVAGTIFASVDKLARTVANRNKQDDDDSDVEEGNEAKMLERVLRKLNALSELTVKKSPIEGYEELTVHDISMLQDYKVAQIEVDEKEPEVQNRNRLAMATSDRNKYHEVEAKVIPKITDGGIPWAEFQDWNFDVGAHGQLKRETLAMCLVHLYETPIAEPAYSPLSTDMRVGDDNLPYPSGSADMEAMIAMMTTGTSKSGGSSSPLSLVRRASLGAAALKRRSSAVRRASAQDDLAVTVANFVMAISSSYADIASVPYHSFAHALDVALTVHRVFRAVHAEHYLSMTEKLGLIVAALAHDIGHGGCNNNFLIKSGDALSLMYNDRSPLENMHCARLFEITSKPGALLFTKMEPAKYRVLREVVIDAILGTDSQRAPMMVKELEMAFEMKQDLFDSFLDQLEHPERLPPVEAVEFFCAKENSKMLRRFFVHFCDQSNSFKDWKLCQFWGNALLEECMLQGEQEAELGLPVNMLFDRSKLCRPKAMLGIMEFCIAPLCIAARNIFPTLNLCEDHLLDNLAKWAREWESEAKPTDAEFRAVQDRIDDKKRLQKERVDKMRRWAEKFRPKEAWASER